MVSHLQSLYEEYERVYRATSVLPPVHLADFINSSQQHLEHRTKCNRFAHVALGLNIAQSTQRVGLWFPEATVLRSALRKKKALVHSDRLSQAVQQSEEEAGVAQQKLLACQTFVVLFRTFYE